MRSFIQYTPGTDFPIQNIPFGMYEKDGRKRACTAIGDYILDLTSLEEKGILDSDVFSGETLNKFLACDKDKRKAIREKIQSLLTEESTELQKDGEPDSAYFSPLKDAKLVLPVEIGDYTDFYSSREHATNVGTMFRGKDNALMPNWLHLPIAYHGRASSIIPSGTAVRRPNGQTKPADSDTPVFSASKLLDFELEMGFFVGGKGNRLGEPIDIKDAADNIFGMVLVNDWSARDIQTWEYQPLGPFLAKNFATSISPWIVTLEALEPFRVPQPVPDFEPMPYLKATENRAYDIKLEVSLQTEKMPEPVVIARSNFKYMYWNICQQLAHHTVNGCNVRAGDLMASGTISGTEKDERGSMLELTWRGTEPIKLPNGEERKFLQDGDTLIIKGWCEGNGHRIGFGEVSGKILPAINDKL